MRIISIMLVDYRTPWYNAVIGTQIGGIIMSNNRIAKPQNEVYYELVDRLPEFMGNYYYSGISAKSICTKLAYARDMLMFIEYAIQHYSYFPEKDSREITIEDFAQITTLDINRYIQWMTDQEMSLRTQARHKSAVSVVFDYLVNVERKLTYNPVFKSQTISIEESDYVIYLNREEQEKLLNCIRYGTGLSARQLLYHEKYKERDLAIIFLFLDTGLRISELQSLNIKDVVIFESAITPEQDEYYVMVLRKGRKAAKVVSKVYFSDESKQYIGEYLETRKAFGEKYTEDSPLFTTLEGKRLSVRMIQQMLEKYVMASLPRTDISVHKLRSSFAMEFYKSEHDLLVLQARMGHRSIAATNIYAKASDKEDAVKKSRNWRT